jgi:hypothetical protein
MERNHSLFPKTIAAARERQHAETLHSWALGDALIEECGPPGEHGVRNGSRNKLRQALGELKKRGIDCTLDHLKSLRQVAANFPEGDRSPSLSITVHQIAGDRKTLDQIEKMAEKKNKKIITVSFAKETVKRLQRQKSSGPQPQPEEAAHVIAMRAALTAAGRAQDLATDFERLIKPHYKRLAPDKIDELVKANGAVITDWKKRIDWLRQYPGTVFREAAE